MQKQPRIRPPHPHPKWTDERTVEEYLSRHYPVPPGMTNEQHVLSLLPRKANEDYLVWLLRLAKDPILAFLLEHIQPFQCDMADPYRAPRGRILIPVVNMQGLRHWAGEIGAFGDLRAQNLKNIGYLFSQNEERAGRYGLPMAVKCAAHYGLLKLGIDSRLNLTLKGNGFFHSNTAMPRPGLEKDDPHLFFHEHSLGPWALMVTSHLVEKNWVACSEGQFGPVWIPIDATPEYLDRRIYEFKWQHYKAVLVSELDQDNRLVFRACTNPELMFRRGLVTREAEDKEWSYVMDRKLDETGRSVSYMKPVEKILPVPRLVLEYRAKLDEQTWPPVRLLEKLKGFDLNKIGPEKTRQ